MTTIRVTQGGTNTAGIVVKNQQPAARLESITNVSATGLSDGDTLIYNATTQKWETKPVSVEIGAAIDGGTY